VLTKTEKIKKKKHGEEDDHKAHKDGQAVYGTFSIIQRIFRRKPASRENYVRSAPFIIIIAVTAVNLAFAKPDTSRCAQLTPCIRILLENLILTRLVYYSPYYEP
jgi:hypothetical protein